MLNIHNISSIPTSSCALVSKAELYPSPKKTQQIQQQNDDHNDLHPTPLPVVIKNYLRTDIERLSLYNLIQSERTALVALSSNKLALHTPKLLSASVTPTAITFTMLRAPGIPAGLLDRPMKIDRVSKIAKQLILAIRDVHAVNIVHADINLRNVIIDYQNNDHLCLVDFGSCFVYASTTPRDASRTTSVHVLAPELVDGAQPTPAADVWGLGIFVWALLFGGPGPFRCKEESDIAILRKLDDYAKGLFSLRIQFDQLITRQHKINSDKADHARDFVMTCLAPNPVDRFSRQKHNIDNSTISWPDMISYEQMLSHPFIQEGSS